MKTNRGSGQYEQVGRKRKRKRRRKGELLYIVMRKLTFGGTLA
jgi:hypothetical protein